MVKPSLLILPDQTPAVYVLDVYERGCAKIGMVHGWEFAPDTVQIYPTDHLTPIPGAADQVLKCQTNAVMRAC